MGKEHTRHHHIVYFLLVFIILLLAFFASGTHVETVAKPPRPDALFKTPLRYLQPPPPQDPPGTLTWGQECGKPGPTKHLLDVLGKEDYGNCMQGLRCRQVGRRLGFKAMCM